MAGYHETVADDIEKNDWPSGKRGRKYIISYQTELVQDKHGKPSEQVLLIKRFLKNALFMCAHGLGPRIFDVDIDDNSESYGVKITYERVNLLDIADPETFPDTPARLIRAITAVVEKLHRLGRGHGDIVGNIGYRKRKDGTYQILLLDSDSLFKIKTAESDPHFIRWAQRGYDLTELNPSEMVEILLENDLTAWMSDDLDLGTTVAVTLNNQDDESDAEA